MKQYRLLNDGEPFESSDELYNADGSWQNVPMAAVGRVYRECYNRPVRRLIEPAQPDIPADGEPVVVWDEFSRTRYRRYSTGKINESGLACYHDGKTKWTSHGIIGFWGKWRRPTQEELA